MRRSIDFYARIGFEVTNTVLGNDGTRPVWVRLEADGASLMLAQADGPVDAAQQAILFYIYCDDVAAMREQLAPLRPGPIQTPFWAPRGEFRLTDPDGYTLMLRHIGT